MNIKECLQKLSDFQYLKSYDHQWIIEEIQKSMILFKQKYGEKASSYLNMKIVFEVSNALHILIQYGYDLNSIEEEYQNYQIFYNEVEKALGFNETHYLGPIELIKKLRRERDVYAQELQMVRLNLIPVERDFSKEREMRMHAYWRVEESSGENLDLRKEIAKLKKELKND